MTALQTSAPMAPPMWTDSVSTCVLASSDLLVRYNGHIIYYTNTIQLSIITSQSNCVRNQNMPHFQCHLSVSLPLVFNHVSDNLRIASLLALTFIVQNVLPLFFTEEYN